MYFLLEKITLRVSGGENDIATDFVFYRKSIGKIPLMPIVGYIFLFDTCGGFEEGICRFQFRYKSYSYADGVGKFGERGWFL